MRLEEWTRNPTPHARLGDRRVRHPWHRRARIDRISVNARGSKAQLYSYFGSKDGLFDAVFREHATQIVNTVPLDSDDLPGYASRLYDESVKHPELVRLAMWARLERDPVGILAVDALSAHKLRSISGAQRAGRVDPILDPVDVLAVLNSMALTWSSVSMFQVATQDDPEAEHDRRRHALETAVRRAFAPEPDAST